MHLKSLVLKGFKSFADRSVVSLEPGITAVVGPNGSGKSNISDAVLWVLGERNAKNLRGQAMEDVIFAGSSARKSVGVAEVDLVLDNADGTLPVDFSEVSLTRRMYRSGESEYLINGAPARRMDFMDILHDTGLGTGAHSIIGQGNLDAILASRPEDRRALIEEAAGVLKHKQRKERSERKLAAMDAHLARVKDVAAEVERQLKPLARKAARVQAYESVSKELAELELMLAVDDLRVLRARWNDTLLREREAAAAIDMARLSADEASAKLENLQALLQEKGLYVGDLTAQRGRFHMALERLESNDMLLREKARGIRERLASARETFAGSARRIERIEREVSELREKAGDIAARRDALASAIDELARGHAQAGAERARADGLLSEIQAGMRVCERELDAALARRAELQDGLAGRLSSKELLESKKAELSAELESERAEAQRLECDAACAAARLAELKGRSEAASAAVGASAARASAARDACESARRAAQKTEGRIAALAELRRNLAGRDEASAWMRAHAKDFDAQTFSVSSRIKVPQELEALVEQLLADDLAALCVTGPERACAIAAALSDARVEGAASVLIASDVCERPVVDGRLLDRIEYPATLSAAMESLLGDVMLVPSFDEAAVHAAQGDPRLRFATPDGFVVRPGAKVSFGSGADARTGLLARERELAELQTVFDEDERVLRAAENDLAEAERALEAAKAESLELSQAYVRSEGEAESARADLARARARIASNQSVLRAVADDLSDALEKLAAVRPEMDRLADTAQACRERRAQLEERRAAASAAREAAFRNESRLQAELSGARLEHATVVERSKSLERECRERQADLDRASKARERAAGQIRVLERAERRIDPLHGAFAALRESARVRVDDLAGKAAVAQSSLSELSDAIEGARVDSAKAQERLEEARAALGEVRVGKGKLEVQVEAAVAAIVRDRGVPIEKAIEIAPPDDRAAAEEQAARLAKRLKSIGSIDPSVAEEYEAAKERYDFLSSQIEDVEAARRALRRIVSAIDARMKEQFDVTFGRVDENFRRIFAQLFPGGSGSLELVALDDAGRLGVEVHAQPRGKKIAKMTLMSGGEKSLVAIALLFAVYSIRHTPFYILDEVEAALDDSNLRRLLAYLDTLRHETQLIMITHQRRTMEMADVLYGVSMQADGVTKVVSQRLDKASRTKR